MNEQGKKAYDKYQNEDDLGKTARGINIRRDKPNREEEGWRGRGKLAKIVGEGTVREGEILNFP